MLILALPINGAVNIDRWKKKWRGQQKMKKIRKVVLVAHDNEGSSRLFETIVESLPDVEFMLVLGKGLYYKKSFVASVIKLLREASWIFVFIRFLELIKFKLTGNTLVSLCRKNDIQYISTSDVNSAKTISKIKKFAPDLLVSLFTMQIYKEEVLSVPKYGAITSHPSILPSYRGLEVFFWVLSNNESHTGVSVFYIKPKIDSGEVFEQEQVKITPDTTVASLYQTITEIGGRLLVKGIHDIDQDTITFVKQEGVESYYPMPTREAYRRFRKHGKKFF